MPWDHGTASRGDSLITLNQERCILRTAADNGFTLYLDRLGTAEKAEEYRLRAKEISEQVLTFLKTGNAASLTQGELRTQLVKLVPTQYQALFDQLFSAVSPIHLDVGGKIGANNVKRIEAVCQGIIQCCTCYLTEDRRQNQATAANT